MIKTLLAILKGNAVVLIRKDDKNADVVLGRAINKRYAINSMVGAVKALML
jgi:hypothetical protein